MSWTFRGLSSTDKHGTPIESSMRGNTHRRYYWGIHGSTEVRTLPSHRTISLTTMVGSGVQYNEISLADEIDLYDSEIGGFGQLQVVTTNATWTYQNCTLDSVTRIDPVPMPDESLSLHMGLAQTEFPPYYQTVKMTWTQLQNNTTIV